jgi:hypothetical protein
MTRWSKVIGLNSDENPLAATLISSTTEREFELAEELIEYIKTALANAEKYSQKFKARSKPEDQITSDPDAILLAKSKHLYNKLGNIIKLRTKGLHIMKRAKWAMYEKNRFDTIIESVSGFVNQLVELFPALQETQVENCRKEVVEIESTEELGLLQEIMGEGDKLLNEFITEALKSVYEGHVIKDFEVEGKQWIGDRNTPDRESKSYYVQNFKIKKEGV